MQDTVGIEISRSNAKRLEDLTFEVREIKQLLKGEEGAPGIVGRLVTLEEFMLGKDGNTTDGILYRVTVLWKAHLWVIALMSAGGTLLIEHVVKLVLKVI